MPLIIILVLAAAALFVAVTVVGVVAHVLFSPWLLLVAAVVALAWAGRRHARR